jgi:hypothetical protein
VETKREVERETWWDGLVPDDGVGEAIRDRDTCWKRLKSSP